MPLVPHASSTPPLTTIPSASPRVSGGCWWAVERFGQTAHRPVCCQVKSCASRYPDAALLALWLRTPPDGRGYYLLAGMRGRSGHLEGLSARLLRNRIEDESHDYVRIYLDWLRKSLTPR